MPEGNNIRKDVKFGEIIRIPLPEKRKANAIINPAKKFDVGAGRGHRLNVTVEGGVVGVIIDARGRPLLIPQDSLERKNKILEWFKSIRMYPDSILDTILEGKR